MNKQLYDKISEEYPWYSFIFQQKNDSVKMYGNEAVKAANILGRPYADQENDITFIELNEDELHFVLPKMIRIGRQFKMIGADELEKYRI